MTVVTVPLYNIILKRCTVIYWLESSIVVTPAVPITSTFINFIGTISGFESLK